MLLSTTTKMHPLEQPDGLSFTSRVILRVGSQGGLHHLLLKFAQTQLLLVEPGRLRIVDGDAFLLHLAHEVPVP